MMDPKSTPTTTTEAENNPAAAAPKRSLYQRYKDAKTGRNKPPVSDEELKKYTGMTRGELSDWARDRPHVAGNQLAGSITVGPVSGFGGMAAGEGFGGWGPGAAAEMKFPPQKGQKNEKEVD
ncbi:hypothetical protein KVR01_004731 [Diaporthe batatas]|uniref:uncharacterized protein n=1 Tax=Diaporthe batatas TaxID=748121 RepID=UPI001D043DDB|nr:uncharacterized protein KVR01_004731 [Diaporthe batatas]KAG8166179.1 hypothetical protein KVR01_004731 [Diaporthe batatas]